MRPDDNLGGGAIALEEVDQCIERLGHVPVPEVPGGDLAPVHRPVVVLGIAHQPRILLGVEVVVLRDPAVAHGIFGRMAAEVDKLGDHLVLASLAQLERGGKAIGLGVVAVEVKAGVAVARALGRLGVDLVQIGNHGRHRGVQAIEVQAVETDLRRAGPDRVVVVAEPADEVEDVGIAPHPGGESLESRQRVNGLGVVAATADIAVNAIGVGPIGLDGHRVETPFPGSAAW